MIMKEFDIIHRLAAHAVEQPGTALGIGDDAALLAPLAAPNESLVEACEIIGFNETVAFEVNLPGVRKAFDSLAERLHAAGYRPCWLLTSIALNNADAQHVAALDDCLAGCCLRLRIQLIGGDLVRGPAGITLRMLGMPTIT
jgi:thiamine-monophosphate kinase